MDEPLDGNVERYADLLDGSEVPIVGFRCLQYLREDGTRGLVWKVDGLISAYETLGMIEGMKMELWDRHREESEAEDG